MTITYPATFQGFNLPGPTTLRNAPGYELDIQVAMLDELAMALQTKLGMGASTPAAGTVLRGTGAGTSAFGAVQTGDIAAGAVTQRAASGGFTGTRTAASYADVDSTNGKATLTTTGGDLLVWMFGSVSNSLSGVAQHVAVRLDAGGEAGILPTYSLPGAATYPLAFCVMTIFAGVSAASHTISARHINDSASGTMTTSGQIIVLEVKR